MSEPTTDTPTLAPALYLLPVTISDEDPRSVLPEYNIRILNSIRHFVVENVRTARRFLKRVNPAINIDTLSFVELSEHTRPDEVQSMLDPIAAGNAVGIMSEAGCPAVADPGAMLVDAAQRRGITVVPLVGPSSILMSLMASGMNGQSFAFDGYLPVDRGARATRLHEIINDVRRHGTTHIFIEAPYRNDRMIAFLADTLPPAIRLCVASDITGTRQSIRTMTAAQWRSVKYDYDKIPTIFLVGN